MVNILFLNNILAGNLYNPKFTPEVHTANDIPSFIFVATGLLIFLAVYSIIAGKMVERYHKNGYLKGELPDKFTQFNLIIVGKYNKYLREVVGVNYRRIAPTVYVVTFYILLSNLMPFLLVETPTANTAFTIPLAVFSMMCVNYVASRSKGVIKHMKRLFEPFPLLFPLNLFGEITPLLSMSFRLFGNILSGGVIISLVYNLFIHFGTGIGIFADIFTPILHVVFDLCFGIIQTMVFALLTIFFAVSKVSEDDQIPDTDENFLIEYQSQYTKKQI